MKEMVEYVSGKLFVATNLDHFTDRTRLHVVDIPTDNFVALIPNYNLAQTSARGTAIHETQEPLQRSDIILSPKRIGFSKLRKALQEGFDIEFRTPQSWFSFTKRTPRQARSQSVGHSTNRFGRRL